MLGSSFQSLAVRPKFFFQFDATNSFVSGRGANTVGVKAGLSFGKKVKFGAGFYHVVSDIVEPKYVEKYGLTYNTRLDMNYYNTFVDLVIYSTERWQFSFLNQFGLGNSYLWFYPDTSLENKSKKTDVIANNPVLLYEPMAMGHFKIMKWFGIEFGTGYRIMLINNKEIDHKLSSPVYTIRLKLFLDEIYNSLFPKGVFKKKKEIN